ncbi:M16 family metallopeptidase [Flavobacterium ardleyense]|uniref:M16 family metallopeptidase n=1 Tax=Flavobacterium ardleyense TaxID=2038737 RepID=UPI00298CEFF9|nr:pitrilysin family protein [Flavobacterium ardleyense]
MKKIIIVFSSLFLTLIMQAQDRPMPTPGPSPTINIKKPQTFSLPNGLKVMVVENHKLPRVVYNLTIDTAPYAEGSKKGVSELTGSIMGSGSKSITKDAFNEEVDFLGADINFSINGASASGLSRYSKRILELMAEGALYTEFTQEELDKSKAKFIEGLKSQEKSVPAVSSRVTDVLAFGKNHPYGEYVSEETLSNVSLADVKKFYSEYFVPGNAYLIVVGDVKFKDTKKMVEKLFGSWRKAEAPNQSYADPLNVQYTQINLVDMPNAVQSEIGLVNTVKLEMNSKDYFPVLVANQVLGGDFNSYLNMNLREAHGWTYGARSAIGGSRYVGKFRSSSQVRNAVTDSAVVEFVKELKRIRTDKVDPETLKSVKAGYIGRFVMQIEKPQTVARYALNIETENLPADFYENYIKNINAVTAEDVMRVANKYFLTDNTRIVVVGKASEIGPGLEKLKIPMFYFDKYGNPIDKPVSKKEVPTGVTAKTVVDNYIKAIGGEKALKAVKSLTIVASGTVQGTPLELITKTTATNKQMVEMKAMGMTMMKQVVNEKGAYSEQQGQRRDLSAEEFAEKKAGTTIFQELAPAINSAKLTGIEMMDGKDVYVLVDGKTTRYYDVTTGLKVAESQTIEQGTQKMTQTTSYDDYRKVKDIKIPYKMSMNVGIDIELNVTDVKINEGVTDADFK